VFEVLSGTSETNSKAVDVTLVVTEFTYQGYPHSGKVWSGLLIFEASQVGAVVEAWNKWLKWGWGPKTACLILTGCTPGTLSVGLVLNVFYDGSEEEGRKAFKPFFEVSPRMDLTQVRPYVEQVLRFHSVLTLECIAQ